MRFRVLAAVTTVVGATLAATTLPGTDSAEAAGSSGTVVVRGTAFPEPLTAQLSLAGCASMNAVTAEVPQPTIGLGPATPPTGTRSLSYDLAGGNAVGALFMRPSMTDTAVADLQVYAAAGSTGVVYAGYQEPADGGTTRVWVGRADVAVPAGGWQRVSAIGRDFAWTKRDLRTGAQLLPGPVATLPAFAKARGGDGAGFYTVGFGCDGSAVSLDAFRVGTAGAVRTFDLEGLATTTSISGTAAVPAGEPARLTGSLRDQAGARVPRATLLLEQRTSDDQPWRTVFRGPDDSDPVVVDASAADPVVQVRPERTTTYRFRFVDRPLAEGSASAPFTVRVEDGEAAGGRQPATPDQDRAPAPEQDAPEPRAPEQAPSGPAQPEQSQESQQPAPDQGPSAPATTPPVRPDAPEQTPVEPPAEVPGTTPATPAATDPQASVGD